MANKPRLAFVGTMTGGKNSTYSSMGQVVAERLQKEGFPVLITSHQSNKILRILDAMMSVFFNRKQLDILVVQVYSGLNFIFADAISWLGNLLRIPIILHVHGGNIPEHVKKYSKWAIRVFRRASLIVTPSGYLAETLRQGGFETIVVPNVIELERYAFNQRINATPSLVWLRAFHQIYNPPLAAYALASLRRNGIPATLTMIGPDKKNGSLEDFLKITADLGLTKQITIAGSIHNLQVPSQISQGDIFLNTTNIDNTPVSVIEAMACGLCIVSTNVGGIPYLLEDEKDALLVPPNDPEAMAAAVERILTEPTLAERLSKNARKKAETFDWSIVLPQWKKIFNEIA